MADFKEAIEDDIAMAGPLTTDCHTTGNITMSQAISSMDSTFMRKIEELHSAITRHSPEPFTTEPVSYKLFFTAPQAPTDPKDPKQDNNKRQKTTYNTTTDRQLFGAKI